MMRVLYRWRTSWKVLHLYIIAYSIDSIKIKILRRGMIDYLLRILESTSIAFCNNYNVSANIIHRH